MDPFDDHQITPPPPPPPSSTTTTTMTQGEELEKRPSWPSIDLDLAPTTTNFQNLNLSSDSNVVINGNVDEEEDVEEEEFAVREDHPITVLRPLMPVREFMKSNQCCICVVLLPPTNVAALYASLRKVANRPHWFAKVSNILENNEDGGTVMSLNFGYDTQC